MGVCAARRRSSLRGGALVLAVLALGACRPEVPQASAPAPRSDREFNLRGTEPFWAMNIRRDGLTLQRPDHPDITVANSGATEDGGKTVWSSKVGGEVLVATLSEQGD